MKVELISTLKTNQNIKLTCDIQKKNTADNKAFSVYSYNHVDLFKYAIQIKNNEIEIQILLSNVFNKNIKYFIGAFIYDRAKIYSVNSVLINFKYTEIVDTVLLEFFQKDFIFNSYLKKSQKINFKLSKNINLKSSNLLSSINYLKALVSEPSNIIYPETFAKIAAKNINKKNIKVKILDKNKIKKLGLRCLLAVNQGSSKEPRVVEFFPSNLKKTKQVDILFVGKGVCFDSGGISIKPSSGMEDMKWDMAGAAVVASIIRYLSFKKTNFSYAGIIGLVENMPSGTAYKPGDIIKSHKGINVEVLNTDAEGRLVLADIISYGSDVYKPKIIIDFATLTGAIMIALGQHYAGLYSNDDQLAKSLYESGIRTNEKVWRMPLHEDFDKELNSPFVDLKNITNTRYGGSVTAAQFLQRFVPQKTKWAHLDIAGVTWKASGDKMNNKGATGFGLTLISDFIDTYFKKI